MFAHVDADTADRIERLAARLDLPPEQVFGTALGVLEWYLDIHDQGEHVMVVNDQSKARPARLKTIRMTNEGVGEAIALLVHER